jgi:hypothetical protein
LELKIHGGNDRMSESLRKLEPMNQQLFQWAKDHREDFEAMGISLEIVDHTKEIEEKKLSNPVQVVFFDGRRGMGEVRVWMSGIAEMEILDNEGQNIYYKHYDNINEGEFVEIFQEFLHNLCKGYL